VRVLVWGVPLDVDCMLCVKLDGKCISVFRPSLWVHSPVKQEDGMKKPYPLTSELQAEARKKLTKAEEDGTAERLHKRAVTRLRKQ